MRPLYHPPLEDLTVEGVLHALSDPVRARIVMEMIFEAYPHKCCYFANLGNRPLAKSTLSQHFRILREAGLIRSERKGVQVVNTLRFEEMNESLMKLIKSILESYNAQMQNANS